MITPQLIQALCPRLPQARCAAIASGLQTAATAGDITTPARVAPFVAQLAHETVGFQYLEEIWGPTPAQRGYEGRPNLGNTQRGDGYRYRGRGFIQLTGRANYQKYGFKLGLPLVEQPDLAARPDAAARLAVAYWTDHGLNALADAGDFVGITRRINGGTNGLADRQRYYALAQKFLAAQPDMGRVLLVPQGGGDPVPWDGSSRYAGQDLAALVPQLRLLYPQPGGPWTYPGLKIWVRNSGDMVLERA